MSGARANTGGGGGAAAAASSIPAKDRKLVQSLKEIVGHGDEEIYAMLKECNMDPNETAQRLMNQDTFHEVKRKNKKKEAPANTSSKDGFDNRSRPPGSYRGGRGDRGAGRGGSLPRYSANESGNGRGKSLPPKENGSHFSSATNVPPAADSAPPPKPAPALAGSTGSTPALPNGSAYYTPSIPPPQGAWSKLPGQATMADILKSNGPHTSSTMGAAAPQQSGHVHKAAANLEWKPKLAHADVVPVTHTVETTAAEASPGSVTSQPESIATKFPGLSNRDEQQASNFQSQGTAPNLEWKAKLGHQDVVTGLNTVESVVTEALKSPPASVISEPEVVAAKFQSLSTREEQVVMPNNFQTQGDLGLSFGSFGETYASSLPSGFSSEDGLDISASSEADSAAKESMREQPSTGADSAAPDSSLMNDIPVQLDSRNDTPASLSTSFTSQSDISKLRSSQAQQYPYLQSSSGYSAGLGIAPQIPTSQHSFEASDSHLQDMAAVSTSMKQQHYADTASFYSPGFRPTDGDVRYPQYLTTAKYNNGAVILPGQQLPLTQEAGLSSSSTGSQTAANTHSMPSAPQQPLVHAYPAQPAGMPLGHFAAYSYPYPSYTLVPSPYQHSYNTSYPQPPVSSYPPSAANYAPVKYPMPQYKPASATNSPLSTGTAGYGGYGSASSMYANAATTTNTSGYEDAAGQFKDSNMYLQHAAHPQQGERMWIQSQLSGDVAAAAAQTSSFYALSGQNQHTSYTQPSNHTHPMAGYTSLYHHPSQPGPAGGAHQLIQPQTLSGAAGSTQAGSSYQHIQRIQQQQQQQQQPNWNYS